MMGTMKDQFRLMLAGAAMSALFFAAAPAVAETPADTLVQALAIDDITTMDPAEAFEHSAGEITGNTYDTLVSLDVTDTSNVVGGVAESWSVSDDGLTYTFNLKSGITFASENPITAEDVAWSIERVIKLNKSPAFVLQQLGLTGDNVADNAKAVDPETFVLSVDKPYAPSFVVNCLAATVASVVDSVVVKQHLVAVTARADYKYDSDFGNEWLKTNSAGSGPFSMRDWRANELVTLERNDNYYGEKAKLQRVIYRHVKDSADQRQMLEAGDIDVARNLEPEDLEAVSTNADLATTSAPKGTIYYVGLNQKNPNLAKPEVREAFKHLVDYDGIGGTLMKGIGEIHQTFLPVGMLGATNDNPYTFDVGKAKELLDKAGLKEGFSVSMDVRNAEPVTALADSLKKSLSEAGIMVEIIPGGGKQTLSKYRARDHDMYIGQWDVDYWDPHANAETFTNNPDNGDNSTFKTLAWRNAWDIPELTVETNAALLERDKDKRAEIYRKLQTTVLETSPFVIILQQSEVAGLRRAVENYRLGPTFDTNFLAGVSKN